jgi:hypothetical protein
VDSVEKQDALKQQYLLSIQQALAGKGLAQLDTSVLKLPETELIND